jgi:hypothetical protein
MLQVFFVFCNSFRNTFITCSDNLCCQQTRILSAIQTGCAVLLIGFMLYIAFYDVQDLPWKRNKEKPVEVKFAPKAPAKD